MGDKSQFIELITGELEKKLQELFAKPCHQGQKIVIHIDMDRRRAMIEMPPEIVKLADR